MPPSCRRTLAAASVQCHSPVFSNKWQLTGELQHQHHAPIHCQLLGDYFKLLFSPAECFPPCQQSLTWSSLAVVHRAYAARPGSIICVAVIGVASSLCSCCLLISICRNNYSRTQQYSSRLDSVSMQCDQFCEVETVHTEPVASFFLPSGRHSLVGSYSRLLMVM